MVTARTMPLAGGDDVFHLHGFDDGDLLALADLASPAATEMATMVPWMGAARPMVPVHGIGGDGVGFGARWISVRP
jgi:hypothetical protein